MTARAAPARAPAPPRGLYLHLPFCVSHCPYCDFVVLAGRDARGPTNRIAPFLAALLVELQLRADALDSLWGGPASTPDGRPSLDTLYLGGGTPSLLSTGQVAELLDVVRGRFGLAHGAEITLEANPGPDERGDLRGFAAAGLTRLSIGAQSFDRRELRSLGRRHDPGDVASTVREARAAGIGSISLDLLYDLPGQTLDRWSATLDAALALEPDHLSLYALTLDDPDLEGLTGESGDHLPVRPGARRWRERAAAGQDEDRAAAMYELADTRLAGAGYAWYEISNWARPGHRSRHNLAYWQGLPYEAVGPGAHAFDGVTRRWNAARLDGYLSALAPRDGRPATLPPGGSETLEGRAALTETMVLRLRTADGLPAGLGGATLDAARRSGLVEPDSTGADVLTLRGRLLSNEVFARLL